MALTYDVRLYSIEVRKDRPKPYRLRWLVGERRHSKSYTLKVQAEGRRSELMSAVRHGDQFDEETGLPVSELRAKQGSLTWYEHSRAYVDRKWASAPAKSRRNYADALATITPALVKTKSGMPDAALMRRALYGWAYNRNRWNETPPDDVARALAWIAKHSLPVSALEDSATVRLALDALSLRLDGKAASPRTAKRKRACLSDVLGLAVEEKYFTVPVNPLAAVKWTAPKSVEAVDPESVPNPRQVRALLAGVREQGPRGRHLEAFFGCLYYAAMRPAEAAGLRASQCHLPETGWGMLTLRQGIVRAGRSWTNDGTAHETRHLKARAEKDVRPVPIPPHFVRMLRQHIAEQGTAPDGPTLSDEPQRSATGDRLRGGMGKGPPGGAERGRDSLAAGPPPLRPAARRRVLLAQFRRGRDGVRPPRRSQHRSAAQGVRQGSRPDPGAREQPDRRGPPGVERAGVIMLSPGGHLGDTH